MKKHLQLIFLGLFISQALIAQNVRTFYLKTAPVIDGHYNQQEWSDADTASIDLLDGRSIKVKFKRDNTSFYFVFYGPIATYNYIFNYNGEYIMLPNTFPEVTFDPLNNNGSSWQNDDQWFHVSYTDCSNIGSPDVFTPTSCLVTHPDWTGKPNFTNSVQPDTIEIEIPFAKLQLNIQTTDTIGFCLMTNTSTGTIHDIVRTWPQNSNKQIPSSWAKGVFSNSTEFNSEDLKIENLDLWYNSQLDKIVINFENSKNNLFKINIFDITGKLLIGNNQNTINKSNSFDVSYLKTGIYFVTIEVNNRNYTRKVVIRR